MQRGCHHTCCHEGNQLVGGEDYGYRHSPPGRPIEGISGILWVIPRELYLSNVLANVNCRCNVLYSLLNHLLVQAELQQRGLLGARLSKHQLSSRQYLSPLCPDEAKTGYTERGLYCTWPRNGRLKPASYTPNTRFIAPNKIEQIRTRIRITEPGLTNPSCPHSPRKPDLIKSGTLKARI